MDKKQKLKNLLYKKEVSEYKLDKYYTAIKVYGDFDKTLKKLIKTEKDEYKKNKYKQEEIANEMTLCNYITAFKNCRMDYESYLTPEITKLKVKSNKNQLKVYTKEAKELAEYEIFGKTSIKPDNIELIEILDDIKNHIDLLESHTIQIKNQLKKEKDEYNLSNLRIELFENKIHIITLKKRYKERYEYYYETFLPKYKKELKEAEENVDRLLIFSKKIINLGIDPSLQFLLVEYEKHKEEKDKLWLFYMALKKRLLEIQNYILENKKQFKLKDLQLAEYKVEP